MITAALAGGLLAQALRLPLILGFLGAGLLIGPHTPGPVGSVEDIERIADLGVVLLMFGIGLQFSFRDLIAYRRLVIIGGSLQVGLTLVTVLITTALMGLSFRESLVLALAVSVSSTVVAVKVLESRLEVASLHGRTALVILIFQDLLAVPMMIVISSLEAETISAVDLSFSLFKGGALVVGGYLVSTHILPNAWRLVTLTRSRELSLLASLTLSLGLGAVSVLLGLSLAFGAFLAGLIISESEYGHQTLVDIIPLRDLFATVFFVGMGMLISPHAIVESPELVVAVILLVVVAKGLIAGVAVRIAGLDGSSAIMTGLVLAQAGEFSFVMARSALDAGVVGEDLVSAFLAASAMTIVLSPFLLGLGPPLTRLGSRLPGFAVRVRDSEVDTAALRRHVIVAGYGTTGASLVRSLEGRGLPCLAVDNNPFLFDRRRERAVTIVYGDASRVEVLERCGIRYARVLAVTFPGAAEADQAIRNARSLNPAIDIIVKGTGADAVSVLRSSGASEVVDPNFEASLEFVRHVLHRFGVDARELVALQMRRRVEHYGRRE